MGTRNELSRALEEVLARDEGRGASGAWTERRFGAGAAAAVRDALTLETRLGVVAAVSAAIPGWRIVRALGEGGTGRVFLALSADGRRRCAVKVLRAELAESPGVRRRFLREAEAARRVSHPNVVAVLDARVVETPAGHLPVLVMDYVRGRSLRERLDADGPLDESACRRIGAALARALAAIHAAGVVHRDVKPGNMMLGRGGTVKLLDLGAAQLADTATRLTQTGRFVGTLAYAAPEQLDASRRRRIDGRADLFATGVLLFESATGHLPWEAGGDDEGWRREVAARVSDLAPGTSAAFDGLVARLLRARPAERPASADEVLAVLEEHDAPPRRRARARAPSLSALLPAIAAAERGEGGVVFAVSRRPAALRAFLDLAARRLGAPGSGWCVVRGAFGGGADAVCDAAAPLFPASSRNASARWDADARTFAVLDAIERRSSRGPVALVVDRLDQAEAPGVAVFASVAASARGRAVLVLAGCRTTRDSSIPDALSALPHVRRIDLEGAVRRE